MANINFEKIMSQLKQTIENLNLKDKWSKLKFKLDQIPIPKWMLVIITSISVVVAIASFASKTPTSDSPDNFVDSDQYDPSDQYDIILEEFALKADRLVDLIIDASDSNHPFAYTKQIETLATECEKLEKKLNAAPLNKRQKLYKDEIKAEVEDAIRRLTWN
jgi:hypothetical protein